MQHVKIVYNLSAISEPSAVVVKNNAVVARGRKRKKPSDLDTPNFNCTNSGHAPLNSGYTPYTSVYSNKVVGILY